MKKLVVLMTLIVALSSCSNIVNMATDYYYDSTLCDQNIFYNEDFSKLEDEYDIIEYIKNNISYDMSVSANSPEETFYSKKADCKGMALFYVNLVYVVTGEKYSIIGVEKVEREIVDGGSSLHVVVEKSDGTQVTAQYGDKVNYKVRYRYTFDQLFN